jgi:hypothetical protein
VAVGTVEDGASAEAFEDPGSLLRQHIEPIRTNRFGRPLEPARRLVKPPEKSRVHTIDTRPIPA